MTRPELTPEEAERLTSRLLRLCKRRKWRKSRFCVEAGISRTTFHRLLKTGFMTRETAERTCKTLGLDPLKVMIPVKARRPPVDVLFVPSTLQAAANYYEEGMNILRAQLLWAAASNLHINLLSRGGSAAIMGGDAFDRGVIRVVTHYFNGEIRDEVTFTLESRKLLYILRSYAGGTVQFCGSGDATETGFGYCLEFLNRPVAKEKLDGKERLDHRVHTTLANYGHPSRSPRRTPSP